MLEVKWKGLTHHDDVVLGFFFSFVFFISFFRHEFIVGSANSTTNSHETDESNEIRI